MEWEDIIPQRGIRIEATPGVTVALRLPKDGRPHISASIGRAPLAALGWRPRQRVRVQVNAAAGLMRLFLTDDPALGYGLLGAASDSTVAVNVPLPGLPHDKRKAEGVENRIEGGALIFSLPAWARGNAATFMRDSAPAMPDKPPAAPSIARPAPPVAPPAPPSLLAAAGDAIRAGIAARQEAIAAAPPAATRAAYRTEERNAVMLRCWPDPSLTRKQIMHELQALPGPAIPASEPTLYDWAVHLGLPSQRSSQPGFVTAEPVAARQPVPAPEPTPDLADAAVAKKTAKAREMLGRGSDPSVVATHCTLPLREVFRLQAEMREGKRAGAAA